MKKVIDDGKVTKKAKERLVVQGFRQVEGVDFDDAFSHDIKFASIRVTLALSACLDLELKRMDVIAAFLNGDLVEDIYMEIPQGLIINNSKSLVCKLQKALYGLKQAPHECHVKIDEFHENQLGFETCIDDPCLYSKWERTSKTIIIITLYVDDLPISGNGSVYVD